MQITHFNIEGPILLELTSHMDERGFFCERFRSNVFKDLKLPDFVQENFSRSKPGVLRGLHYQWHQPQGKLITALKGKIFDVAVDIRKTSPTLGQHISVILDGNSPSWFWIPPGFAHGFVVLENQDADVMYKVDNYWNGSGESGIIWNDSDLKINWPISKPLLSSKDLLLKKFSDYITDAKF